MKRLNTILCTLCAAMTMIVIASCSSNNNIEELTLSTEKNYVITDSLVYGFNITSGNGDYKVKVENDEQHPFVAKTTVTGNHIDVDLIYEETRLTITDAAGQTAELTIISQNSSLRIITDNAVVKYGDFVKFNIGWGNGGYYIYKQDGDAAKATIDNEGEIIIKSVHKGNMHLTIADRRGSTNEIYVSVYGGYDITGPELSVKAQAGDEVTFPIKYGDGQWTITSCPQAINNPFTCVCPKIENCRDLEMLQVKIPQNTKGSYQMELQDKSGHTIHLILNIE
jgi:hypothetical protein